jgi:hypothetical protein
MAEPTVELTPERAESPAHDVQGRSKMLLGMYRRLRPIRAAAEEAERVYELERVGESEWTPWIAIAALILCFAVIGLLMFGVVEAALHLLASASSES